MKLFLRMTRSDNFPVLVNVLFLLGYFILMIFPNFVGSKDLGMVRIFEPDEGVPLPYVFDMIKPADTVKQALTNFADYNYYFYGYPYFAYSALVLIPVKFFAGLDNFPWVMLVLRQMVSVLPVLLAVYLLGQMFEFPRRKWVSLVILVLLLATPGVVKNNFWWHPDGMVVLAVVLTIFFLNQDEFRFGRNFYLAAAFCGIATGIKYTGVFFVLTIAVYLGWGLLQKKITFVKMALAGFGFILVMGMTFLVSNPLLIFYPSVRRDQLGVLLHQSALMSTGFNVIYPRGLKGSLPIIQENYGSWIFLVSAFLAPIIGIIKDKKRLLNTLILTWAIPLTMYTLSSSIMKFQYILPVIIPLFSSLSVYVPSKDSLKVIKRPKISGEYLRGLVSTAGLVIILVQLAFFVKADIQLYTERVKRELLSPSVTFVSEASPYLGELMDQKVYVYHDVRLYVPDEMPWNRISIFKLLTYEFIQEENPVILLLAQQRIRDYLNPDVVGVDPELLESARQFYRDADEERIRGYVMVYRNDFGLAYVREDVYRESLAP